MKESYYNVRDKIKKGYDIVFVARNSINGKSLDDINRSLYGTLKACGLFVE